MILFVFHRKLFFMRVDDYAQRHNIYELLGHAGLPVFMADVYNGWDFANTHELSVAQFWARDWTMEGVSSSDFTATYREIDLLKLLGEAKPK